MCSNSIAGGMLLLRPYTPEEISAAMARQMTLADAIERMPRRASEEAPSASLPPLRNIFGTTSRAKERIEMVRRMSTLAAVDQVLAMDGLQADVVKAAKTQAAVLERIQGADGEEAELRRMLNGDRDVARLPGAKEMAQRLWQKASGR